MKLKLILLIINIFGYLGYAQNNPDSPAISVLNLNSTLIQGDFLSSITLNGTIEENFEDKNLIPISKDRLIIVPGKIQLHERVNLMSDAQIIKLSSHVQPELLLFGKTENLKDKKIEPQNFLNTKVDNVHIELIVD